MSHNIYKKFKTQVVETFKDRKGNLVCIKQSCFRYLKKRQVKKWLTKIYKYNEETTIKSSKGRHRKLSNVYRTVVTHEERYAESSR